MVRRPNITAMVLTPLGEAVDNEADHRVVGGSSGADDADLSDRPALRLDINALPNS
jgi:hypothetical protein